MSLTAERLSYLIDQARNKQKSVWVTLIDLKNSFGEVRHGFIEQVLKFDQMPIEMISFILTTYINFTISVATDVFVTNPVKVPPVIFNMCFNTLMLTYSVTRYHLVTGYNLQMTPR